MALLNFLLSAALLLSFGSGVASAFVTKTGAVGGQTWTAGTYQVTGDLTVAIDSTLVLEPGCVVKFNANTGLRVNGTLLAHGTETDGIVFTGRDDDTLGETLPSSDGTPAPGDWDGIQCYGYVSSQGVVELEHGLLRYGGGSAANYQGGLYLNYSDRAEISHTVVELCLGNGARTVNCSPAFTACQFNDNGGHGLAGATGGQVSVRDCSFTGNAQYGAYLNDISPASYAGNSGSGNGTNALALSGALDGTQEWEAHAAGFPLVLLADLGVSATDTLTIGPGVVVKALPGSYLDVDGVLRVQGGADSLVVLTSIRDDSWGGDTNGDGTATTPAPGNWRGITCNGYLTNPGEIEMDWCVLRYGGDAASIWDANLYFQYSDRAVFRNSVSESSATAGLKVASCAALLEGSTFRGSLGHGVEGVSGNSVSAFGCQFLDNGGHGAWLASGTPCSLGGNGGSGNGVNGFAIAGTTSGSLAWSANQAGFPYILGSTLPISAADTLAIGPGVIVKGAASASMTVNGTLVMSGAADSLIVFTSIKDDSWGGDTNMDGGATSPAPGDWRGIDSNGYLESPGIIEADCCLLRYGGNAASNWDANLHFNYSDAGLFRNSTSEFSATAGVRATVASPQLEQSNFNENLGSGIVAGSTAAPDIHGCVFTGHPGAPTTLNGTLGSFGGNSGSGNGINGLCLGGSVATATWQANDPAFPYVLTDDLTVPAGDTLRLEPGVLLKAQADMELRVSGVLLAPGTEADPIRFTSLRDDEWGGDTNGDGNATTATPGDWDGLYVVGYLDDPGELWLDHGQVRFGGGGANDANVFFYASDQAELTDCLIERSATAGIRTIASDPVIGHSRIVDNVGTGVFVDSGTIRCGAQDHSAGGDNVIAGNEGGGYQVRNTTNNVIEACYNDWGVYDAAAIDALIFDDNESGYGEVVFDPFIDDEAPTRAFCRTVEGVEAIQVCWRPVQGATGYVVYSSDDPREGFAPDLGGAYNGASWTTPLPGTKRFYQVRVVTD